MARTKIERLKQKRSEKRADRVAAPAPLMPSPSIATNLLIADIVLRSASSLFRRSVERRIAQESAQSDEDAEALLDGRTIVRTLALYSASKVATRSRAGLGLVVGGLALKTLYDRGKARRRRLAAKEDAQTGASAP